MTTLIGLVLLTLGGMGIFGSFSLLASSRYYQSEGVTVFTLSAIIAAVGVLMIIFSVIKKRNEDSLNDLMNMTSDNKRKDICPKCGLNLAPGTIICPKCGSTVDTE